MVIEEYIKTEHIEDYLKQRENLEDRVIEAQYNRIFLDKILEKNKPPFKQDVQSFGIHYVLRRIYITIVWELVMQIYAITEDVDSDILTINQFKNRIISEYIREEKKGEFINGLNLLKRNAINSDYYKRIREYRNKIICHNFLEPPKLNMNVEWIRDVMNESIEKLEYLSLNDGNFKVRCVDLENEKKEFIDAFLDKLLE